MALAMQRKANVSRDPLLSRLKPNILRSLPVPLCPDLFGPQQVRLPDLKPCAETPRPPDEPRSERIRRIAALHRSSGIEIPPGWTVVISPEEVPLVPGEEVAIQVAITPPPDFVGERAFNINAFGNGAFAGGVTLAVTKS